MSRRQKAINSAVRRNHQNKQYILKKRNNIYPKRTSAGYIYYKPKQLRIKQLVEPATHLGPLIALGKNKPVGKNITLADIYNNKPTPEQKKKEKPVT